MVIRFARATPALAMLALALAACGTTSGEESGVAEREEERETAAEDDAPRGAAAAAAMLEKTREEREAGEADASAKSDASAFIDSLLGGYARNQPIDLFGDPGTVFEPALAAAVEKAVAREMADEGAPDILSADPICGCQDWGDFSHRIDTLTVTGDRATAKVTVRNFGEASSRTFDLVKTQAGWRIFDLDGEFRASVLGR